MSNCPVPSCTVEGIGMRLSWDCDWAAARSGRKRNTLTMSSVLMVVRKNVTGR
jgi:hypothetical protein